MKALLLAIIVLLSFEAYSQDLTTVILVRHAEKGVDASGDPELTDEGRERAALLARMLDKLQIDKIYSTPFKRTRQTVMPVAEKKSIDVEEYNPFDLDVVYELIEKNEGTTMLFSGHSNTVPIMLNKLVGEDKYKLIDESDYDNLFIVTLSKIGEAKVVHLTIN